MSVHRLARELSASDLCVNQPVRVFDTNGSRMGQPEGGWPGRVVKIGRTLVTIDYPAGNRGPYQFRLDTRQVNDNYGHQWFRTEEEAEAEQRLASAVDILRGAGITIEYRSSLTADQVEELAAVVVGWSS
jgi:hypothetical protein